MQEPEGDLTDDDQRQVERLAEAMRECRSLLFITGAGVSADSGLPTYRGVGGLYHDDSVAAEGLPIEAILSGRMMQRRPELVWEHLARIERVCRGALPNVAHEVIAKLETRFERVWVLTQNVDGLHRLAGSNNIIDIHGDMHQLRCDHCRWRSSAGDYSAMDFPPTCPQCGSIIRPDVVLFEEMLPMEKIALLDRELRSGFDMVLSIGTTSVFPYISGPVEQAARAGRWTVEINPGPTEVTHLVDLKISARAAPTLEALFAKYRS